MARSRTAAVGQQAFGLRRFRTAQGRGPPRGSARRRTWRLRGCSSRRPSWPPSRPRRRAGSGRPGVGTRSPISMPEPVRASCFMLDMETKRSMRVTPSQCRTSGINCWKRGVLDAGDAFGAREIGRRLVRRPAGACGRCRRGISVTSPSARPSLRIVDDQAGAAVLGARGCTPRCRGSGRAGRCRCPSRTRRSRCTRRAPGRSGGALGSADRGGSPKM